MEHPEREVAAAAEAAGAAAKPRDRKSKQVQKGAQLLNGLAEFLRCLAQFLVLLLRLFDSGVWNVLCLQEKWCKLSGDELV